MLVPVAGAVLLTASPAEAGPEIIAILRKERALGLSISWCLSRRVGAGRTWLSALPAQAVVEWWHWLDAEFARSPYEQGVGLTKVTPLHEMSDFRLVVFQNLVSRTNREACAAMGWLMRQRPQDFWLGDYLASMRKAARGTGWRRPDPVALKHFFADPRKRLLQTSGELQAMLLDAIRGFEKKLHGSPPSRELWNERAEGRNKIWDPKDKQNLSDCLKLHIDRDLEEIGIIADREVQVRPLLGADPAQLLDILVQTAPVESAWKSNERAAVVVEVKCAWNQGVLEDMEAQLHDRYLATREFDFGIYIVAYFECDAWNRPNDPRRQRAGRWASIGHLRAELDQQALRLSSAEKRIEAIVLDARISRETG